MADRAALADTTDVSFDDRQQATIAAIRSHHEQMGRTVADHTLTIQDSIDRLLSPLARRDQLLDFATGEVLPHALAEEGTLYRTAEELPGLRLLVRAMRAEHTVLHDLVDRLEEARTQGEVAGAASALNALFQAHLAKENDVLLPALAEAGVDLDALLAGMHEILGAPEPGAGDRPGCGCGGCGCGGSDAPAADETATADPADPADPADGELDVRGLVPAQRHRQIFATFEALAAGTAFVLVNDHDPKPLYYQFAAEYPGRFVWEYLEAGPVVWRVRIGLS
ncbi:DUF2249 domain-containing protein [Actinorugispora endophytica]|uniref:Uncharacterized protein (DUF2249 family) n=1 Tax=Actinorugispora endophytica TaxID=1605990 RepID=A0A4R6V9J7_9ACTN|nr:DUF2249 domain-containing protein [Actinorugispora endophytica]TDQ53138.1 uncharacterized protein (DUF2249 family) [Actinorugispora endophytica]